MKTRLKKSLSVLLTLAMLFSTLSSSIVAVGDPIIPQPDYAPIPDVLPIEEASEPELPPPLPAVDGSIAPDDLLETTGSSDLAKFLTEMTITSTDGSTTYVKDGKVEKEITDGQYKVALKFAANEQNFKMLPATAAELSERGLTCPSDWVGGCMFFELGSGIEYASGLSDENSRVVTVNGKTYVLFKYTTDMNSCFVNFQGQMHAGHKAGEEVDIVVGTAEGKFTYDYVAAPTIEKIPGEYNPETGMIHYTVRMNNPANGGDIKLNTFKDAASAGKIRNVKIPGLTEETDYTYDITGSENTLTVTFKDYILKPNNSLTVEYDLYVKDMPGKNTIWNGASFEYDGNKSISANSSKEYYEWQLEKSGYVVDGSRTESGDATEIVWRIKIVTNSSLNGKVLKEMLPEGLKVKGEILAYSDYNMTTPLGEVTTDNGSGSSDFTGKTGSFDVTLKDTGSGDREIYLKVVTTGTSADGVITNGSYSNTASIPGPGPDPSTSTGNVDVSTKGPGEGDDEPKFSAQKSDPTIVGDKLTYTVTMHNIKESQLKDFYMKDEFQTWHYFGDNASAGIVTRVNTRNAITIESVTSEQHPDINKDYFKVLPGDYPGDEDWNNSHNHPTWIVYDESNELPDWAEDGEDGVFDLTFVYTIDASVAKMMQQDPNDYNWNDTDQTLSDFLKKTRFGATATQLQNYVWPYGSQAQNQYNLGGGEELSKTGSLQKDENGKLFMDYTVKFVDINRDANMALDNSYLRFVDDFGAGLTLESLSVTATNTYTGEPVGGPFTYNGTADGDGSSVTAYFTDFKDTSGRLFDFFKAHHADANITYEFTYRLKIDDTRKDQKFKNSAKIMWNDKDEIGPAVFDFDFEPVVIDKSATLAAGKVKFTVEVNKYEEDLLNLKDTILFVDKYNLHNDSRLSIDRGSIEVAYWTGSYWQTMDKVYWEDYKDDGVVDAYHYNYTLDETTGELKILIPDKRHLRISYDFVYTAPEAGDESTKKANDPVTIDNKAELRGVANASSGDDWFFQSSMLESGFEAEKNTLTLIKKVTGKDEKIEGATFILYDPNPIETEEVKNLSGGETLTRGGKTFHPAAIFTTNEHGKVKILWNFGTHTDNAWCFALKEISAPGNYKLLDEPVYFTMDTNGNIKLLDENLEVTNEVTSQAGRVLIEGGVITVSDDEEVMKKVTVHKVWEGGTPTDVKVKITLYANDVTPVRSVYLPMAGQSDPWTYEFTNLDPKITYTVKESELPAGWKFKEISEDKDPTYNDEYTITNTKDDKVKITVRKVWENVGEAGKPVDEVKVKLYADGSPYKNGDDEEVVFTLNEGNGWEDTIENLPKYQADGETVIEYTVEETTNVNGWETEVTKSPSGDNAYEFTVTNTNTLGSLKIEKELVVHSENGEIPEDISGKTFTFDITSPNGYKNTVTITGEGSVTVDNLKPGTYTVTESSAEVSGYTWSVKGNKVDVVVEVGKTATATVTNTYTQLTKIPYSKEWVDSSTDPIEDYPEITVKLMRKTAKQDKAEQLDTANLPQTDAEGNKVWSGEFSDLPMYDENGDEYIYTIDEEAVPGWTKSVTGTTIINTRELIEIPVEKIWEYNGVDPTKIEMPKSITFTLTKKKADGEVETVDTLKLTAENAVDQYHWKGSFKNLPKYDAKGNKIDYDVTETPVTNWKLENSGKSEGVYTFTNTPIVGSLSIKKNIDVYGVTGGEIPADLANKEFTFNVTGPGYNGPVIVTGNDTVTLKDLIPGEYTITEADAKVGGYDWVVSGDAVSGIYVKVEEGKTAEVVITNKYGKIIDIPVEKRWNKNGVADEDINMPKSITFTLKKTVKGETVDNGTLELPKNGAWSGSFTNLPKIDKDGNEISYSVEETDVEGWTSTFSVDENGKYTFTNTKNCPDKGSLVLLKKLEGIESGDAANREFTFHITGPNGYNEYRTIKGKESINISGLEPGEYTVEEVIFDEVTGEDKVALEGYKWMAEGSGGAKVVKVEAGKSVTAEITNKYEKVIEIPVKKVWDDKDSPNAKMPESITVHLVVNGETQEDKSVTLTKDNGWSGSFTNLPKYDDDGNEIKYNVVETEVDSWELTDKAYDETNGYTLTNTFELGSLTITKALTVHGKAIADKEFTFDVTGPNGYTAVVTIIGEDSQTLEKLVPGEYTVTEKNAEVNGYAWKVKGSGVTVEVEGNETTATTVTNTYTELTDIPYNKEWVDDSTDPIENYPEITVKLMRKTAKQDKAEQIGTETLPKTDTEGNKVWNGEFTNLPKYDENGDEYIYTIDEEAVLGWTKSVTGTTITNTRPTTSIDVTKGWYENDGTTAETHPSSITVNVKVEDQTVATAQLPVKDSEGNEVWEYKFDKLPKYDDEGEEINYTVEEVVPKGWTSVVSGNGENVEIRNKRDAGIEIPVTKVWDDKNSPNAKKPDSITVVLKAGDEEVGRQDLTVKNNWSYKFTNLPKYDDEGNAIAYTVEEVTVPGWTSSVSGTTITNTAKVGDLEIKKNITGLGEDVAARVYTFEVTGPNGYKNTVNITGANTKKLENLAIGEYTVKEVTADDNVAVSGYKWVAEGAHDVTVTVEDGGNALAEITNKYVELTDIDVTKVWDDKNSPNVNMPDSITVVLKAGDEEVGRQDLTAENGWSYKFTGLDKYDSENNEIVYTVEEVTVPGWTSSVSGTTITNTLEVGSLTITKALAVHGTAIADKEFVFDVTGPNDYKTEVRITGAGSQTLNNLVPGEYTVTERDAKVDGYAWKVEGSGVTVEVKANETATATVTNTYTELTDIDVTKAWDYNGVDPAKVTLPESITVVLKAGDEEIGRQDLTAENNWSYKFTNLPKYDDNGNEIDYTVEEVTVPGWTSSVNGTTITNTLEVGSLTITKALTVHGTAIADKEFVFDVTGPNDYKTEVRITGADSQTLNNLVPGEYTVTERDAKVEGYTWKVEGSGVTVEVKANETATATVTNTYTELTDIDVTKAWDYNGVDPAKVTLPESITVVLKAGDEEIGRQDLTAENNWTYKFTGLDKYDEAGEEISYTVEEVNVPGWTSSVDGTTITNTLEVGSLTITKALIVHGTEIADKEFVFDVTGPNDYKTEVRITGAGSQTLNNLVPGEYTVTERDAKVDGYTWKVEGSGVTVEVKANETATATVTNTYTELTDIDVTKVWDDKDSPNANMPDSITVVLKAGDEEVGRQNLTAANDWSYKFTGLDKYDSENNEIVYTVEEVTVPGWTSSVNGTTITNTLEVGSLTITKALTVHGTAIADKEFVFDVTGPNGYTTEVRITGSGSQTLNNLVPGEYTVTERDAKVDGYKWTVSDDGKVKATVVANENAAVTITNTYTEVTSIMIAKEWYFNGSRTTAPTGAEITVSLYADGVPTGMNALISELTNWTGEFTNLDVYAEDGHRISYTVSEVRYQDWTSTVTGSPETGFIIRNSRFYIPTITPIIPETPEVPEVPDTPDTPEIPEIPDRPIEPIIPEIPDLPEVPDIPDQPTIPFREIPDLEVPLVEIKDEQVPLIDIPDLGVPLRAIPATGDNSHTGVWAGISAGSALGIAILAAALMLDSKKSKKRREDAE